MLKYAKSVDGFCTGATKFRNFKKRPGFGGEMQMGCVLKLYERHKNAELELLEFNKVRKVRQNRLTKFEKLDIMRA